MVACFPLLRGRRSAPHIPWPFLDLTLVLSRCKNLSLASFLKVVARPGLMSVLGLRHGQPGRTSSFFGPFLRSASGAGLHS